MSKKSLFYQEKGSMAIYAIATILCFLMLLGGVFFSSSIVRKSQLRTLLKIKDIYAEQIKQVSQIEENRKRLDVSGYTQNGLVLFYDGINNTGSGHSDTTDTWTDLSNTENNGILTNMQENGKNSWRENSLHFDGKDDVVVVPYQNSLALNEYTIELVLNRSEVLNNNRSIVFVKWMGYTIELNANKTVSFGYGNPEPYLNPTDILELNEKYYITATFKNNVQKLYINGIQVAEKTGTQTLSQQQTDLTIGGWTASANDPFIGNIYSVRMYNRELTGQEINNNYNLDRERYEVKGYIKDGMVLHYDGINNTGKGHDSTTAVWKDLSGNGNDLTLHNFNQTETSGWKENSLKFDGADDYGERKNPLYNAQGAPENMTIEVVSLKDSKTYGNILSFDSIINAKGYMGLWTALNEERVYEVDYYWNASLSKSNVYEIPIGEYPINTTKLLTYGKNQNLYYTYLDGEKRDEKTIPEIVNWANDMLYLGKPHSNDYYFSGQIKSVRIYNRSLSQEEIKQNYQVDKTRFGL